MIFNNKIMKISIAVGALSFVILASNLTYLWIKLNWPTYPDGKVDIVSIAVCSVLVLIAWVAGKHQISSLVNRKMPEIGTAFKGKNIKTNKDITYNIIHIKVWTIANKIGEIVATQNQFAASSSRIIGNSISLPVPGGEGGTMYHALGIFL